MTKYKCLTDDYSLYKKGMIYNGESIEFGYKVSELVKKSPSDWDLVQEFTKGDEILASNSGEIWRERIFQGMYNDKYVDCDFKIWNHAKKKPLLITEDGIELFNGNDIVHCYLKESGWKDTATVINVHELKEGTKFFSTPAARQSHINSVEPEYVQFTIEDSACFLGKTVKSDTSIYIITGCTKKGIYAEIWYCYERAFKELEFIDGSPFGKQVK